MKRTRRNHKPAFKAKVAMAAVKGDKTISELAEQFGVHANQIQTWRRQLVDNVDAVFGSNQQTKDDHEGEVKELHAKIGQLTMERDFLEQGLERIPRPQRKEMIDRDHQLPVTRQCQLLDLSRSSYYYQPNGVSDDELKLMEQIDKIHLRLPFYGSRRIKDELEDSGVIVNRKKVQRLMRVMGIMAIYPKKNTSRPGKGHKIYPYLLRHLTIDKPNQVWCTDLTYIPMAKGFAFVVAIMDWHSRKVLSWRISNSMDADFCVDALEEAIARYGRPEIFNSDQGSQFTSDDFTKVLKNNEIQISMDGKGRWVDNVFIERLWRSLKYEDIYLKAYESISEARLGITEYFRFYNEDRRHQSLERKTPDQVYGACIIEWDKAA
ncbi:MAG: IS3 family transposase [Gammaproteobacteria bacterium]|nr:MAG: IS3 family transposase [Gammaproteobacteria bacterium]